MRIPLEDRLPYTTLTLLVLAAFYGIYFAKVLAQKGLPIVHSMVKRYR